MAAQATVNQMVQLVFGRVQKLDLSGSKVSFAAPMNSWGPSVEGDSTVAEDPGEGIQKEKDAVVLTAAQQTKRIALVRSSTEILGPTDLSTLHPSSSGEGTLNDKFIKDAFLVFRALSKLSMKPIPNPER